MDETFECYPCHEYCALCLDETNTNCQACKTDYYLFPESTICLDYCPTGIIADNEVCDDSDPKTSCFTFDNKDTAYSVNGVTTFVPVDDDSTPRPVYMRGIYFDGDDTLQLNNLILNVSFSLSSWIRPDASAGSLLEIVEHFKFAVSTGVYYEYIPNGFVLVEGEIVLNTWQSIAVGVSKGDNQQ